MIKLRKTAVLVILVLLVEQNSFATTSLPDMNKPAEIPFDKLGQTAAGIGIIDEDSEVFVRNAIASIGLEWNVETYLALLHPNVLQTISHQEAERTFFVFKKLGTFKSIEDLSCNMTFTNDGLIGFFVATVQFENAEAHMTIQTIRQGGKWYLLTIFVKSLELNIVEARHKPNEIKKNEMSHDEMIALLRSGNLTRIRSKDDSIRPMLFAGPGEKHENRFFFR